MSSFIAPIGVRPSGGPMLPSTGATPAADGAGLLTAAAAGASAGLEMFSPQGATNIRIPVLIAQTGVVQPVPGVHIPPGAKVILGGYHGQAVNAADVWVGSSPEEVANGGRRVPAGYELEYPVDNTAQIFVKGTQGDGLLISVVIPIVG